MIYISGNTDFLAQNIELDNGDILSCFSKLETSFGLLFEAVFKNHILFAKCSLIRASDQLWQDLTVFGHLWPGLCYGQKCLDLWPNEIVGMAMAKVALLDIMFMTLIVKLESQLDLK